MAHLFDKTILPKIGQHFVFDGARLIDAMIRVIQGGEKEANEDFQVSYQIGEEQSVKDLINVERLKEELGSSYLEVKMKREFTRNNLVDADTISNKFQNDLYNEFVKINNTLACFFLYFYHIFYWQERPFEKKDDLKTSDVTNAKLLKPTGMNSSNIINRIKTVYPYLHNLFVGYLQEKYGDKANIALMNLQDAKEQLAQGEILGQIAKIKPKRQAKLTLVKK